MNQTTRELDNAPSNLQEGHILQKNDQMQALRLLQTIQKNGEIHLQGLPVVKGEQIEMLLLFGTKPQTNKKRLTARQLLNSDLIGLWKDRTDITDSVEYARELREKALTRNHDNFGLQ